MFTKAELMEQSESLHLKPLHFLKEELFSWSSHPSIIRPESEQFYSVHRGRVQDFDGAMQFYCNSIVEAEAKYCEFSTWETGWQFWARPYIEIALCRPLSWYEFVPQADRVLAEVRHLVELPNMDEFVEAMLMQDEWNDMAVLAEFKAEFVYMEWSTSA